MKPAIVSALAVSFAMLGACATTSTESAALSPDQIKVELASVSQQIIEIDAWLRVQHIMGRDVRDMLKNRAIAGRLMHLIERQKQLRVELAESGYPRTAEEVRESIMEIDQVLAKRGETLAPAGAPGMTSSLRTLVSSHPALSSTRVIDGLASDVPYVAFTPVYQRMSGTPGSASRRSVEWQTTYSLKEERAALHAKLRTLEQFEN